MRRRFSVGLVGALLSVALSSDALAAPNATVTDKVEKDEAISVIAANCVSGPNYTAYADITITRADGSDSREYSEQVDNDASTPEGFNIVMPDAGSFNVRVVCRHTFSNGTNGTWYDESEAVTVTGLTADEKKRCKNKRTSAARRRCLRRARAN